jgi:uncharacterized membrane protein required for colicin V production
LNDLVSKLTWADIIALIALARGLYIGYKSGLFQELLRVAAYIVTMLVTMILFEPLAQILTLHTFLNMPVARGVAFGALLIGVYIGTKVVRTLLVRLLKVGEGGGLNRLLGMVVACARLLVLLSFLFLILDKLPLKPLQDDVHKRSLTGDKIASVAPALMGYLQQLSPQFAFSLQKEA